MLQKNTMKEDIIYRYEKHCLVSNIFFLNIKYLVLNWYFEQNMQHIVG